MLIFRPNQGSSVPKYVNIALDIPVTTIAQASTASDVVTYGQAIDTAKLYANKVNETFNTPITVPNPVNNTDTVTRKFLFDTIFAATKANVTPILDQYTNNDGGTFTGPVSRVSDPYNLNNTPTNDNTAITNKFANDKLNQATSLATGINAVVTGQIYEIYGQTTPSGYLKCNGAAVSKTIYSDLYAAIGDQYTPQFKESGGVPWQSQYGFNSSTQNDISPWASTNSLATGTYNAASLVTKNYIYILGGTGSSGTLNTIQRTSFDANGALSSTWSNVGTLPAAMHDIGYVATKGRFYLIGGYYNSSPLSSVYSAPINADGTLGTFRTETSLPATRANSACFVIKDKLYVVGGTSNNGGVNTVYQATINTDGTLSSWATLSNFPISPRYGEPLLIKDKIYIFGAYDGSTNTSKVYYAIYDSNGNIGAWTYVSTMPNNIYASAIVGTNNYVFSIGGYDQNNGQFTNASYRASILADGSIGSWAQISNAPITAGYAQSAIAGNNIYFIGGSNGNSDTVYSATFTSGIIDYTPYYTDQPSTSTAITTSSSPVKESAGVPWQSQWGFNPSTQNDITGWTSTNSLTTAVRDAASLVTKNYMYILGGCNQVSSFNTIQRASFDSDGNLTSTWSNVGTLPATMHGMGYVTTKGRFYLIGGTSGPNNLSTVYSAPINADGTLGTFRTETSLPDVRYNPTCFVIKDKLYVVGGFGSSADSGTVYSTTINTDGTLSSWTTLPNFPINFDDGKPLLIKDRIYIFGANSGTSSKIYYATYDSNGNIGTWTYVANMPNNIYLSTAICTDNYVFSIGGIDQVNNKYTDATYRAPILSDGSIGTWTQVSNGPVTATYAQSAIAGNRIYFIGGLNNSTYLNTVYSATFASGITDYTLYYTDQSSTSSSPVKESAGIPWQSQWGFNPSTQSDITGWVSSNSLVQTTYRAASLVTKNYIYILGGNNGSTNINTIQRASFDSNGNLSSTWSNVGTLPDSISSMGYIATKSRFYLIGGVGSSSTLSTVYSAPINADGTLGTFRTETLLPDALIRCVCFVIKDKLYVVGGSNNTGLSNTVYQATINSDGTLSSWTTLPNFPISFNYGTPMLIKDRIYIFGAYDGNSNSKIYYATYDSDGNIGSWTYVSTMPNNTYVSAIVCTDNYVFSIDGYSVNINTYTNASYCAPILSDGSIGTWTQISICPAGAGYAQLAIAGNMIYFIGGYNGTSYLNNVYSAAFTSGITDYTPYYTDQPSTSSSPIKESAGVPWQSQYGFNSSTQNDITGWSSTNSLVTNTMYAASLVTKNYIYILGGEKASNSALDTIQRASFDSDGNLTSTWSNVGTLPVAMYAMGYVATKGRFYLIGGRDSTSYLSTVYSAPINADGTLGAFRTETALPDARYPAACFVIKNKLYVVGGWNSNLTNTIYSTTINADGTLNNWTTLPNFPIGFIYGKPLLIKDRIYIIGVNNNANNSRVYYTTYDSNGDIGSWTYVGDMPYNISLSTVVCTDNYVFNIGGSGSSYTNATYRAPILIDGSIGTWTQISNAPVAVTYAQSAIAGNKIYFIGGYSSSNNSYLNTVYSATFASGITDYTPYYTDQSNQSNTSITFMLPNLPSTSYSAYYIKT
jgi:N-acetylneuraminic acid mutarotase